MASLAGFTGRSSPFSGVERAITARDLFDSGYFSTSGKAYDGNWRSIHGSPHSHDARSADGRLAHHPFRMDARDAIRVIDLHCAHTCYSGVPGTPVRSGS